MANYSVVLPIDKISASIILIAHEHKEIHEGKRFYHDELVTLAAGGIRNILLTPPTGYVSAHLTYDFSVNDEVLFEFFEGTTVNAVGTALTSFNRNRRSDNTALMTLTHTPTIAGDGTRIAYEQINAGGSGKSLAGDSSERRELILAKDQLYLCRVTAVNNNTDVNILLDWYEEDSEVSISSLVLDTKTIPIVIPRG